MGVAQSGYVGAIVSSFVLVSLYEVPLVEGGSAWRIYGWRGAYDGVLLDTLLRKDDALDSAFRAGVPVIIGSGGKVSYAAARLAGEVLP